LGSYRQEARFYTWLYRIVANTSMDLMRSSGRRKESMYLDDLEPEAEGDASPATAEDPAAVAMRREQTEAFERGLGDLSEQHRMVLILREVEGMSYGEIARTLGVRPGTVMSRLYYARKAMQKHLEDWR
jgi:RNA polymerase sigma-70 factor (ECF subfamily)